MTLKELLLIPKHIFIREQPHPAQVLLDNSIKHKKPQLSCLNRLRPLNATTNPSVILTPETLINAIAENNQQEQALLLIEDERINWKQLLSLITLHPLNVLFYNYNSWTKKLKRAKKFLEIIKKSERVIINKDNEELYVDKIPTGLKASVFFV